jgi:hypothetical protein
MPSLWRRVRDTAVAVVRAVRNPASYAPPPLPTTPEPAAKPRPAPTRRRPTPRPTPQVSRPIPRRELPPEWGANKAALWIDATKSQPQLARDETAQMFYDAALFTHSEEREQRDQNLANFKEFIMDEYGIDWDDVFDWEDYRENYDLTYS